MVVRLNKRGDLAVTILVFMIIVVFSVSIYLMIQSNGKVNAKIQNFPVFLKADVEKATLQASFDFLVRDSLIESYNLTLQDVAKNNQKCYTQDSCTQSFIDNLKKTMNARGKGYFSNEQYSFLIGPLATSEISLFNGSLKVVSGNFEMSFSGAQVLELKTVVNLRSVQYFRSFGLHNFDEIIFAKKICVDPQTKQTCLQQYLPFFELNSANLLISSRAEYTTNSSSGEKGRIGFYID